MLLCEVDWPTSTAIGSCTTSREVLTIVAVIEGSYRVMQMVGFSPGTKYSRCSSNFALDGIPDMLVYTITTNVHVAFYVKGSEPSPYLNFKTPLFLYTNLTQNRNILLRLFLTQK